MSYASARCRGSSTKPISCDKVAAKYGCDMNDTTDNCYRSFAKMVMLLVISGLLTGGSSATQGQEPAVTVAIGKEWPVKTPAFSPDGKLLAIVAGEGTEPDTLIIWDLQKKRERARYQPRIGKVESVVWSPTGSLVALAGGVYEKSGEIKLWDVAAGKEKADFQGHSSTVCCVAFSPDGATLVSASLDKTKSVRLGRNRA